MAGEADGASTTRTRFRRRSSRCRRRNRFNIGFNFDTDRLLGSATVNYSDEAFWSDVLTSQYHGFTDAYTLVERQLRREVGRRQSDRDREGQQPVQQGHPAARLRRHHQAVGYDRGQGDLRIRFTLWRWRAACCSSADDVARPHGIVGCTDWRRPAGRALRSNHREIGGRFGISAARSSDPETRGSTGLGFFYRFGLPQEGWGWKSGLGWYSG